MEVLSVLIPLTKPLQHLALPLIVSCDWLLNVEHVISGEVHSRWQQASVFACLKILCDLLVLHKLQHLEKIRANPFSAPKKIAFSFVPLKKYFFLIYSRLSFSFPCVPLLSRKYTLKVIFIKDVSRNKILKIITHKRELLRIFQNFIELFNTPKN
jgi:hypothetical protein